MPFNENSVVEMTVLGKHQDGQNVINVFHYRKINTTPQQFDNNDLGDLASQFNGSWAQGPLLILSNRYSFQTIVAKAYTGTETNPTPPPATRLVVGEQFVFVNTNPLPGARAGECEPSFVAVGVQKLSSRAGRNFRGGTRFGAIAEPDILEQQLEPGLYLPLVQTEITDFFAQQLQTGFGASTWEMCIFSRTLALAAPPPFGLLRDLTAKVTGAKINVFASSQVSRKQSPTQPT